MEQEQYKVIVVGAGGVGKTTWIRRIKNGYFENKYIPTIGVEVTPIILNTEKGPVNLIIWDCAGQDNFAVLREGYFIGANAAIILEDEVTNAYVKYIPLIRSVCKEIPILIFKNVRSPLPITGNNEINVALDCKIMDPLLQILQKLRG